MKKYLTHSVERSLKERKEYYLYDIPVSYNKSTSRSYRYE